MVAALWYHPRHCLEGPHAGSSPCAAAPCPSVFRPSARSARGDFYYVDKTGFARRLIAEGKSYFLSRPRRFGKSLFLDTLAELFEGNEALFQGLEVHDRWDWSRRNPLIRLSFGGGVVRTPAEFEAKIREQLAINRERLELAGEQPTIVGAFAELIRKAHAASGERVVVLVDEYDKPILDNLTDPDTARALRDGRRNLYSVIKDSDAHIRFAFLTGVSKFSKVSLFSDLNNLFELTVSADYSALCGYTEADLDQVFAPELEGLERERIRAWYNGYRNNPIARYEGYYASVFYSHLAALGLDLVPEDASNQGRLDLRLRFNGRLWLFEFKVVELEPAGRALQQLKDRGYAEQYRAEGLPILLIGIEFSRERRTLSPISQSLRA